MPEIRSTALYGTPLERYRLYRDYLQHEDELIHQRLNWMLLLQGFLFAAYASMYSGLLGHDPTIPMGTDSVTKAAVSAAVHSTAADYPMLYIVQTVRTLAYVLPILGYVVALLSLFGVQAARNAIKQLERQWKGETCAHAEVHTLEAEKLTSCLEFPGITGGGAPHIEEMDSPLPFGIPTALCVAWTFLGIIQIKGPDALRQWRLWGWWSLSLLLLVVPAGKLALFTLLRIGSLLVSGFLAVASLFQYQQAPPKSAPLESVTYSSKYFSANLKRSWIVACEWAKAHFLTSRLPSRKNGLFHHASKNEKQ